MMAARDADIRKSSSWTECVTFALRVGWKNGFRAAGYYRAGGELMSGQLLARRRLVSG